MQPTYLRPPIASIRTMRMALQIRNQPFDWYFVYSWQFAISVRDKSRIHRTGRRKRYQNDHHHPYK
jgi:hypothetical protein